MDSNFEKSLKFILLLFLVFVGGMLFYGVQGTMVEAEVESQQEYVEKTEVGVTTVIRNYVSDQNNDFFAFKNNGDTLYVTVNGEDGDYTHESVNVEKGSSLDEMKSTSIERSNKPKPRSNTSIMPILIPR